MEKEFITITEYCINYNIDPSFIVSLEESGIIVFSTIGKEKHIHFEQFTELDSYIHLHYDLQINIEGIDAIRHLLGKVSRLQTELNELQKKLRLQEL